MGDFASERADASGEVTAACVAGGSGEAGAAGERVATAACGRRRA